MALSMYTSSARDFCTGGVSWVAANYNIVLLLTAYTFSAAHAFRSDLTNEVANGGGYTTGGLALAGKSASSANPSQLTGNDIVVAQNAGGFTAAREYACVKILGGAATADPLLAHGIFAADQGNVGGQLTLDLPTNFIGLTVV